LLYIAKMTSIGLSAKRNKIEKAALTDSLEIKTSKKLLFD
jgi:hypothetical protein